MNAPEADGPRPTPQDAAAGREAGQGPMAWWPWSALMPPPGTMPAGAGPGPVSIPPERLASLQNDYVQRLAQLWSDFLQSPERTTQPIADPRFADPAWQKSSLASFYARAYLLNAEFMSALAGSVDADPKTKARLKFAVQQWVEAASPSNFLALNPKVQQRIVDTQGESLTHGVQNLLDDLAKGKISQADDRAFEVGRNVGASEGMVVFENDLFQLIQYRAATSRVRARPFLLVPPCINKYYILDLQPDNSFVRYCVEQGNTVFIMSWKNPHEDEQFLGWDDYVERGPITALRVVREITGHEQCNALGFCVGGTILATALAVLYARGERPVASLTLLTALLDFSDTGILDIFVDEAQVRLREQTLGRGGLMPGADLANTFSSLRPNDLVWNYVVSNYLEGKTPPAFDLLYWNGDSTNLPGPMYCWYLRNTYLENNLRVPGKVACCGQFVDLRLIDVPTYVLAAREDHIVPWKGAYYSARTLEGVPPGRLDFVLGASGHIAGTINPASRNKRSYWKAEATDRPGLPPDPDAWLATASEHKGSWWIDWNRWLAGFADGEVEAPAVYGSERHRPIEPAPGRYVKEKA